MLPGPESCDPEKYKFRGLHPAIFMGTASDRYAGWIGQIYSPDRYKNRLTTERAKSENIPLPKKFCR